MQTFLKAVTYTFKARMSLLTPRNALIVQWLDVGSIKLFSYKNKTRKPSRRWQTRATRNHAKNCCSSTLKQVTENLTNNLFEAVEIPCLVMKFLIQIRSTYSRQYY